MPKGIFLWDELSKTSNLLEIYYDDLWLEMGPNQLQISRKNKIEDKLYECIKICSHYAILEQQLFSNLINEDIQKKYFIAFGEIPFSTYLINGVKASLKRGCL